MRSDPLARISTVFTPQTQPIPGRAADQVRNNAGGYTFAKDTWAKLEDWLILGTTGGTYYTDEAKHTLSNVEVLNQAIAEDGPRVVALLTDISTARPPRAVKQRPALFALAACYALGDAATKQATKTAVPQVARTTDHLASFFGYCKQLRGKPSPGGTSLRTGRSLRTALGSWFLTGTPDSVAFKACKANQRKTPAGEPLALRDVLRIAHPRKQQANAAQMLDGLDRRVLLGWLAGKVPDEVARETLPAVDNYLAAKAVRTVDEAIAAVTERRVPWEFLPSQLLGEPRVWDVLVDTIGMTALIRNLARMTSAGTLTPFADATRRAAARLTNGDALLKAHIHPMDVWLALRVYASGQAKPNPKAPERRWNPVAPILDALEEAWDLSFGGVQPSGKRLLVVVDSSTSMDGSWYGGGKVTVGGSPLGDPYEVGCAMAVMLARIERDNAVVVDVSTQVHSSKITARTNLREIATWTPSGGGTDLSQPFQWAKKMKMNVDGFVVMTDNETWAGRTQHPSQALASYRAAINPQARVVVASMTAAGHSIADPRDPGVLQMAGLDASLPVVVSGFVRAG